MTFSTIELSRRGAVALLGLNRPDKLNAINATMIDEINQALELQPGDPLLEELLMNTYQAELGVMANASQLTSMNGALAPMDPARIRL